MINEIQLIWQLEDFIDDMVDKASKSTREESEEYMKKVDFLKEQIKVIKAQPRWDTWYPAEKDPPIDGRYIVYQIYLDDGYKEVTTAVFKKGRWCLDTGEFNIKYSSYTMRRQILYWAPLQSAPIFEDVEAERRLLEAKNDNEQVLM